MFKFVYWFLSCIICQEIFYFESIIALPRKIAVSPLFPYVSIVDFQVVWKKVFFSIDYIIACLTIAL